MQLRDRERHPYAGLRSFTPQRGGELRLYQAVREAVPVVDAAVCKLIRLSGGTKVFCEDPETEKRLRDFLERVPARRGQYGINAFLSGIAADLRRRRRRDGACGGKPGSGGAAVRTDGPDRAERGRKPAGFSDFRTG